MKDLHELRTELGKVLWALGEAWDAFWFCYENHDQLRSTELWR